jgi:hypothetical protein
MSAVMQLLGGLGPWNWLILAVFLFCLEVAIPGVHFLWFGVAAVVVGLLALATGMAWQIQLVLFAVVAIATVFLVRRYVRPDVTKSDLPNLNERGQQYVGRVVTVAEAITGGRGKVRVGDSVWQAEGPDMPAGTAARITGSSGTVLRIEPAGG